VYKNGSVLVRKRPANLVNGGLWEFPNLEIPLGDDAKEAVLRFGLECEPLATIKHTITTNRITLRAFAGRANAKSMALAKMFEAKWHSISDLHVLPFSSAHARLREVIQGGGGSRNKGAVA
jgi:adenine-specific DNA glycosylase